jgi:hypothetical protein
LALKLTINSFSLGPLTLSKTQSSDPGDKGLPEKVKQERLRWAEMLKRVFDVDVTICPKCQGRMEQIAVIKDKVVAKKILESLGEVTTFKPLEMVADRGPPQAVEIPEDDFDQRDPTW